MKMRETGKSQERSSDQISDRDLVLRTQHDDIDAFETLVERYDRRVLSLAFSYARNSDDAKDIYQETLIRAFRSIKAFELKSEFSTWLYRIAINVCLGFASKRKRREEMFMNERNGGGDAEGAGSMIESAAPETVEGEYMRMELAKEIERALGLLSPMQRLVFTLKHYEGYRLKEIARMASCTEGTVKKHLYVAVRRLQEKLSVVLE